MALDKNILQAAIYDAFEEARKTDAPDDPSQTEKVQQELLFNLSTALASAIDVFVRSGDIDGVMVEVKDTANANVIGTGTQTDTVHMT